MRRYRLLPVQKAYLAAVLAGGLVTLMADSVAHAAGSGMPWEAPLQRILESIEGRMTRHGGRATVRSAVGGGTEVELTMPRQPS